VQCFDLDLSAFKGMVPVELSGSTRFPAIGERPYFLNLGPFAFYWFVLERQREEADVVATEEVPLIGAKTMSEVFADRNRDALGRALERYVSSRRWFGGKAKTISDVRVTDSVQLGRDAGHLALIEVEYADAESERYVLPLAVTQARRAEEKDSARMQTLIARLKDGCLLYEPVADPRFADALLDTIARKRTAKGAGTVNGVPTRAFRELRGSGDLHGQVLKAEQSNTAIVYGETFFMKLFRRVEPGVNTDLEITRFLNEQTTFDAVPRVAGSIEYAAGRGEPATLAILQSYTHNSGDAWTFTLDAINRFFDDAVSRPESAKRMAAATADDAHEMIGTYIGDAEILGRRTAQMHNALASRDDIAAFAPEPITPHYQRSIYQHIRTQAVQTLQLLRRRAKGNPDAEALLAREGELQARIRRILDGKLTGLRIRTHGDYHLGQVLHTGADFVIIDFEGEPSRPLSERRIKRSALRDVAGMLRSFHYAPYAVVFGQSQGTFIRTEDIGVLESGARFWHRWVSAAFLGAYLEESAGAAHLPRTREELHVLLDAHLLEKALYEISYELNNRPDWARIPIRGVLDLLTD
jgi:maltose alpha-D-glucosyltransferase/alpha-amylase